MQVPLASYGAAAAGPLPGQGNIAKLPKHVQQDMEIQQLCELYQQQLAELNACHSLLTVDQERLAAMLAPYVNAHGELVMDNPDPDVMLFKNGLDLRLREFEEDCKRIQQTERRLQVKIDEATREYERAVQGMAMSSDSRVFKRLREQQRLIEIQQSEIDQIRFEKDVLQTELQRLREMTQRGDEAAAQRLRLLELSEMPPLPNLHTTYNANLPAPNLQGTRQAVLFGPGMHAGRPQQ